MNVVVMIKGVERYVILYDDENRKEALRTLGRMAANAELSFDWFDAMKVSKQISALERITEDEHVSAQTKTRPAHHGRG